MTPCAGAAAASEEALYSVQRSVPTIFIELDAGALRALAADPRRYVAGNVRHGEAVYRDVRVRFKGHRTMSSFAGKPSFKLKFDAPDPTQRLLGRRRITLNSMVADRSLLREWLAYRLFRDAGIPAPRVGYAHVAVNGECFGLYANVEPVDAQFLERNFGDATGQLYEGEQRADVTRLEGYELDEGNDPRRAALAALRPLAAAPAQHVFGETSPLDVPHTLRYLAVEALVGHWDGYAEGNNHYLYRDPDRAKWVFIPWGTDMTFKGSNISVRGGRLRVLCLADPGCAARHRRVLAGVAAALDREELFADLAAVRRTVEAHGAVDGRKTGRTDQMKAAQHKLTSNLRRRLRAAAKAGTEE